MKEQLPSLGLVGCFDVPVFSQLTIARIIEEEVTRRCPVASVRRYSPLGWDHPVALDGGSLAEPLGPRSAARELEIVQQNDLLVLASPESGGDGLAEWFRDAGLVADFAIRRLEATETRDLLLLANRLCSQTRIERRLALLRTLGRWPSEGRPVVIDSEMIDAGSPEGFAELLSTLQLGSADTLVVVDFEERPTPTVQTTVASRWGGAVHHVPAANVEHLLAAISAAGLVVTRSPSIAAVARSFEVPLFAAKSDQSLSHAQDAVDQWFDGLVDDLVNRWHNRVVRNGAPALLSLVNSMSAEIAGLRTERAALEHQLDVARMRLIEATAEDPVDDVASGVQ